MIGECPSAIKKPACSVPETGTECQGKALVGAGRTYRFIGCCGPVAHRYVHDCDPIGIGAEWLGQLRCSNAG